MSDTDVTNLPLPVVGMARNKSKAIELLDKSFLSDEMTIAYKEVLEAKYKQLGI